MKTTLRLLGPAVLAPFRHWRLGVPLWLARLAPILLVLGVPLFDAAAQRSAHHPDARLLLDPAKDPTGFAYRWTSDFFRGPGKDVGDTIFWVTVFSWMAVTVLLGGITSTLLRGTDDRRFMERSGRFAARLLRLALLVAVVFYWVDFACNTLLMNAHGDEAATRHTQDLVLRNQWTRGLLFLGVVYVIGLVHCYGRIELVARDRSSAVLSFFRGFGMLVSRLPAVFLLELGLVALSGIAALFAWLALKGASPLHADASWGTVGVFATLALVTSYLRTGVELGALEARCRLLFPAEPEPEAQPEPPSPEPDLELPERTELVSHIDTVLGPEKPSG